MKRRRRIKKGKRTRKKEIRRWEEKKGRRGAWCCSCHGVVLQQGDADKEEKWEIKKRKEKEQKKEKS